MAKRPTLIEGQIIGGLTLLHTDVDNKLKHICRCQCGVIKSVWKTSLVSKTIFSCGCMKQELRSAKLTKKCNTNEERQCSTCSQILSIEEFGTMAMRTNEYRCRSCRISRSTWLDRKRKYGISKDAFDILMRGQENKCKICTLSFDNIDGRSVCVDHCHITQAVRGILCKHCNFLLGHARDDVSILESAIIYINNSKHNGV